MGQSEIWNPGGGGGGTVTGTGTTNTIPRFTSASAIGDSLLKMSGTNGGTATLYDPTAVTGASSFVIRQGAADVNNSANYMIKFLANDGSTVYGGVANGINGVTVRVGEVRDPADTGFRLASGSDGGGALAGLNLAGTNRVGFGGSQSYTTATVTLYAVTLSSTNTLAVADAASGYRPVVAVGFADRIVTATASGASTALDLSLGGTQQVAMNASTTFTLNNPVQGITYTFQFTQDATGSRTVTLPASFKPAGGTFTATTTANKTDVLVAVYDGTNYREKSRAMNQ